ncbi:hypothetical protein BpHYR1_048494 [Brachionus plicatilis]|uniref:Uncharacterized protein n=1 Tax=Brachionus plicatilis TaxID=10195 RepID=A0A3M7PEC7_BRAPC|nr:hypothetical protein BpHYR1_048494 [Brachionus plicatilis]
MIKFKKYLIMLNFLNQPYISEAQIQFLEITILIYILIQKKKNRFLNFFVGNQIRLLFFLTIKISNFIELKKFRLSNLQHIRISNLILFWFIKLMP